MHCTPDAFEARTPWPMSLLNAFTALPAPGQNRRAVVGPILFRLYIYIHGVGAWQERYSRVLALRHYASSKIETIFRSIDVGFKSQMRSIVSVDIASSQPADEMPKTNSH